MAVLKKVNILGTEYTIVPEPKLIEMQADGVCKRYDKEISVRDAKDMLDDIDTDEAKRARLNEVFRHEIIHAYFAEAGLMDVYGADEQLVDWIAIQFPKMLKSFQECDCL